MAQTQQDKELNTSVKLESNLDKFYDKSKADDIWPWYGTLPIDNNTSIVGMRWRGIKTVKDIWLWVKWNLFLRSLQDWDFRYDPYDRQIYCYGIEYKDFSTVENFWNRLYYKEWDYVMDNWKLYLCIQDTDYTTPITDLDYRIPQIWIKSILPYGKSSLSFYNWFSSFSVPSWRQSLSPFGYQWSYYANDNFGNWANGQIIIPQDWFYLINERVHRLSRPWNINIASRLQIYDPPIPPIPLGTRDTLSDCYRNVPTITATSSWWITTTIDPWVIANDTTMNTWMWYLKKWDKIRIELFHDRIGNTINIEYDRIQATRLF